jgi:hypothetical protein
MKKKAVSNVFFFAEKTNFYMKNEKTAQIAL